MYPDRRGGPRVDDASSSMVKAAHPARLLRWVLCHLSPSASLLWDLPQLNIPRSRHVHRVGTAGPVPQGVREERVSVSQVGEVSHQGERVVPDQSE
jgi:hypothetical protein